MTLPRFAFTPVRFLAGALSVASLLCAATAAARPAAGDALAPGWQAHAQPLFREGPGVNPASDSWRVPAGLPAGRYAVIERRGDEAEVIDGVRFDAPGTPLSEIHLMLSAAYSDVEAIPVADLPAKVPAAAKR